MLLSAEKWLRAALYPNIDQSQLLKTSAAAATAAKASNVLGLLLRPTSGPIFSSDQLAGPRQTYGRAPPLYRSKLSAGGAPVSLIFPRLSRWSMPQNDRKMADDGGSSAINPLSPWCLLGGTRSRACWGSVTHRVLSNSLDFTRR